MKNIFLLWVIFVAIKAPAQFLDVNIFKPRIVFEGEYLHPTQSTSMGYWSSNANLLFPIKGKLNFDLDWKKMLKSKSIKEVVGNVTPKAYQLFGELGYQTQQYQPPSYFEAFQTYKAGLTGIWVKYKNKKIKTLLLSGNVRFTTSNTYGKVNAINPSLFAGTSVVHGLKNFVVVGGYASYYGDRFIASPVLFWYHRFSSKWSTTMILPVQGKLTWSKGRKFKQELVVSYYSFNHATSYVVPPIILTEVYYLGVNFVTGVRFSTQSKIRMGKSIDLYLEAGWQELTQSGIVSGYKLNDRQSYNGSLFAKMRVNIAFGKALVKPKLFDLGL